tara:strand:- start:4 stop:1218 length:1215 start_codon:yes stop_codon:yes gene_type:complete
MPSTNVALATLLESDGSSSWRAKANKVDASVENIITSGTAENDGLIKIGSAVTGVGAVTSSYSFNVNSSGYSGGYSPMGGWTAGWMQNQDNLAEWGLYAKVGATTYGTISFQGQGTDWVRNTTGSAVTRNVNIFTPVYGLEKASGGADLTGIANQTFLDNAVDGIKNSSPNAFDTLGEIASALPSSANASAYINLNTSTRVHTFEANGSDTEFSVSHTSGNVDVFVDGSLYVPQLSDSASGATTLLTDFDYFSNDGSTSSVTQYAVDHTQESTLASGTELVKWIGNWGGEWGVKNYYNKTVVLTNGSRITTGGVTLDPSFNDPTYGPWFGFTANTGWPAGGFYRQSWGANITGAYSTDSVEYAYQMSTTSVNVPVKIETSGSSCSKIVFQFAPNSGQVITVKTY